MISENVVDTRPKNFLTEAEVEGFLRAARKGRYGIRNFAMMILTYRRGLRVSELVDMRIADVDLNSGRVFVRRKKRSLSTSHMAAGAVRGLCFLSSNQGFYFSSNEPYE